MDLHPVILCGGTGERLSPLSTPAMPKQFLPLAEGPSLFAATCARAKRMTGEAPLTILTTIALEPLAQRDAPTGACFVLEPLRRNTAAAIAMAATAAQPEDVLWIMPCDHLIADEDALANALSQATASAMRGHIALLGIQPTHPHTGYGYVRSGPAGGIVHGFTEKPDEATALNYIQSGLYWWNAGMVIARADILVQEFAALAPVYMNGTPYTALPALPFDTAILEKTDKAVLIPADMGWRDVGGVDSLDLFKKTG